MDEEAEGGGGLEFCFFFGGRSGLDVIPARALPSLLRAAAVSLLLGSDTFPASWFLDDFGAAAPADEDG